MDDRNKFESCNRFLGDIDDGKRYPFGCYRKEETYSKAEADEKFSTKAEKVEVEYLADVVETKAGKEEVNELATDKANKSEVVVLSEQLANKADTEITTNLQQQINSIVTGVPAEAEVLQARVSADGTNYPTLKSRLDSENTVLKKDFNTKINSLKSFNCYNLLDDIAEHTTKNHNGIQFTWNADNTECHVTGTATASAFVNMYYNLSGLPFEAGHTYTFNVDITGQQSEDTDCKMTVIVYLNGAISDGTNYPVRGKKNIYIPENCTGIIIRLEVRSGGTVDAFLSNIYVKNTMSNKELEEELAEIKEKIPKDTWEDNFYNLQKVLQEKSCINIVPFLPLSDGVNNGISYNWLGTVCHVSGTATGSSFNNLYGNSTAIPRELVKGQKYKLKWKQTVAHVGFRVLWFAEDGSSTQILSTVNDAEFTIPEEAVGVSLRLYVPLGYTIDGDVEVEITNDALSNAELEKLIENNPYSPEEREVDIQLEHSNKIHQGITYTWSEDACTIAGTSYETSLNNLYYNQTVLPIKAGKEYWFDAKITDRHITLEVYFFYSDGSFTGSVSINDGKTAYVPKDAVGMVFRIRIPKGYTVNGTVSDIHIYENPRVHIPKKMISVIDDDTSSDTFVTRFHDACSMNGIKGNFAVMMYRLEHGDTSVDKLIGYEDEGYGMLLHAYWQSGATDWNEGDTRNLDNCRENIAKAIRMSRSYGFCNADRFWVTPGGNKDADMEYIARIFSFDCLISTANRDWNHCDRESRYFVKRFAFNPTDTDEQKGMQFVKGMIDKFMADDENGWLIITTHFNEWESAGHVWDDQVGYSRFNELIKYAKNAGCDFRTFPEAWSYFKNYCID